MTASTATLPGVEQARRFRPRLAWELLGCALHGHELLGTVPAHISAADERDRDTGWAALEATIPTPAQPA